MTRCNIVQSVAQFLSQICWLTALEETFMRSSMHAARLMSERNIIKASQQFRDTHKITTAGYDSTMVSTLAKSQHNVSFERCPHLQRGAQQQQAQQQ